MRLLKTLGMCAGAALILLAGGAAAGVWYLDHSGVSPRQLSRYVAPDATEENPWLARGEKWAAAALQGMDRRNIGMIDPPSLSIGAQAAGGAVRTRAAGREIAVASAAALRQAIDQALPGDVITLAAGIYRFAGANVAVRQPGTATGPIMLRGAAPGAAIIEFDTVEGFLVSAPYWRFEQLSVRGVCASHSTCEHAFHVVGDARNFAARNNTIADFNAHFKINGSGGRFPDHGAIEGNTLTNSAPRRTANPVTPIDLVGASHWRIRRNLIADFIKQGGDGISYGAYAKGGGSDNAFEQNIVWCERLLRDQPGQRVGLSLGGGGTFAQYCRDGKCITEQDDSVISSNLIASCSDDGVYINSAARSRVFHNTLIGTAGIALSSPTTSADVEGNLVDGPVHSRNGAISRELDNRTSPIAYRYFRYDPNHGWFASAPGNSLGWIGSVPRRAPVRAIPADLCGTGRPATPAYGAFEDFSACQIAPAAK